MQRITLIVAAALVFAACSGSDDTGAGDTGALETGGAGVSTETQTASDPVAAGSGFCRQFQEIVDEIDTMDFFDPNFDISAMYAYFEDAYAQLRKVSPDHLDGDFAIMLDGLEKYTAIDPESFELLLTEEEDAAFEASGDRIAAYAETECGIVIDDDIDDDAPAVGTDKDVDTSAFGPGDDNTATQTVTLGGEAITETLSGPYEVSCDLIGDLKTGSVNVYLTGQEFESSASSYDSGVNAGTYGGQIWVFASDPALGETTWDLQEIDGEFVFDRTERVSDITWLFVGSYSAAATDDPSTSIEAIFTCEGFTDM